MVAFIHRPQIIFEKKCAFRYSC